MLLPLSLFIGCLVLSSFFSGAASAAPFVTATPISGKVTGIVSINDKIHVAREDFPTVLVYDGATGSLDYEVSLLFSAQLGVPTGATSIGRMQNGKAIVATAPFAEVFVIENGVASSMGTLPSPAGSETITVISAMYVHTNGYVYFGARSFFETAAAHLYVMPPSGVASSASPIKLALDTTITAIGGLQSNIVVAGRDTPVGYSARIHIFDTTTSSITHRFTIESAVTAIGATSETVLLAFTPSGNIRNSDSTIVAAVSDTVVRAFHYAYDGADTVLFLPSDSCVLKSLKGTLLRNYGTVNAAFLSIRGMASCSAPQRHYGIARGAAGSFLFYYDTWAPWVESVRFSIETGLRQPTAGETYIPPLTRGTYIVRVRTNERLAAVPQVTVTYSNGATQSIAMTGALQDFTGIVTIDSSRPPGTVSIAFVGADDAGNTGTVFISGQVFELQDVGRIAVANNMFRPNFGEFATVRYLLLSRTNVSVKVYNMRGQMVADLSPGMKDPGEYEDVKWNGRNTRGELVGSGVYYLRFDAGEGSRQTSKVIVVR